MTMRVIFDTQSNLLFRGIKMEQDYDQRGGLCQAGSGDIVVTTNPIDPDYLNYWQELGFALPRLITAGPFDPTRTLSELVLSKEQVRREIQEATQKQNGGARLEFFCIEESERELTQIIGIPPYCEFDVSIPLAKKQVFKEVCAEIGLPTPRWGYHPNSAEMLNESGHWLKSGKGILLKANYGTGGISCGGMHKIETFEQLDEWKSKGIPDGFFVEEIIPDAQELALHWEIDENGKLRLINIFRQLSSNYSYAGVTFPVEDIPEPWLRLIKFQLEGMLGPYLIRKGAKGFFCCDILVGEDRVPYWVDFNPRKGAILYIWDMVCRLSKIHFESRQCCFWHQHIPIKGGASSFREIKTKVGELLTPRENSPFAVITNPGIIQYGFVDITGISLLSKEEAQKGFETARLRIDGY